MDATTTGRLQTGRRQKESFGFIGRRRFPDVVISRDVVSRPAAAAAA